VPEVVGVIQARMGSSRLPGKVLMDIEGHPMIDWVHRRLSLASSISQCIVATTVNPRDDELARYCESKGWSIFRGSEEDVLDRFFQCVQPLSCSTVVRVTADCPLVDPAVVDAVVRSRMKPSVADYASNILDPRTFPRGLDVEAISIEALAAAWRQDRGRWREHVTPYIYNNPNSFSLRSCRYTRDVSRYRWTVDTPDDLALIRELVRMNPDMATGWEEYLQNYESAGLHRINEHIQQVPVG
jgi:spore coat polysaccharide biosynthesis protein SpsF